MRRRRIPETSAPWSFATIAGALKIPASAGALCGGKSLVPHWQWARKDRHGEPLAATRRRWLPITISRLGQMTEVDTVIDLAFDGINCRVLRNKKADELMASTCRSSMSCGRVWP
jgi:hypothetical protein